MLTVLNAMGPEFLKSERALRVLAQELNEPPIELQVGAAGVISNIGPEAKPLIPDLLRFIARGVYSSSGLHALARIGPEARMAVPVLNQEIADVLAGMLDSHWGGGYRTEAAGVLLKARSGSKKSLDFLKRAANSKLYGSLECLNAARVLAEAGRVDLATSVLLEALGDSDPRNQADALQTLANCSSLPAAAIPALKATAKSKDPEVRKLARERLEKSARLIERGGPQP